MSATIRCRPGAARSACSGCCASAGERLGTRSDRQAEEGLKLVQELQAADALQLKRSPLATSLIDRIGTLPAAYLAHEYMNDAWPRASTPMWRRRSPTPSWSGPARQA